MTQDGRWIDSLPERIVRGLNHLRNANNIFEKIPSYAALEARIAGEALLKDILYGDTKNTKKNPTYKFLRETARAQNLISDIIYMRLEIVGDIANYTSHDHDDSGDVADDEIKLSIDAMYKCYIWHLENKGILPEHSEDLKFYINPKKEMKKMISELDRIEDERRDMEDSNVASDNEKPKEEKDMMKDIQERLLREKNIIQEGNIKIKHIDGRKFTSEDLQLVNVDEIDEGKDVNFRIIDGHHRVSNREKAIIRIGERLDDKYISQYGILEKLRKRARINSIHELWVPKIGDVVRFRGKNGLLFEGALIKTNYKWHVREDNYDPTLGISPIRRRIEWFGLVLNNKTNKTKWFSLSELITIDPDEDGEDFSFDDFIE